MILRPIFRGMFAAAMILGFLFYLSPSLATSAGRTGWYVLGSGVGTLSHTATNLQKGQADSDAENNRQAQAAAPKPSKP